VSASSLIIVAMAACLTAVFAVASHFGPLHLVGHRSKAAVVFAVLLELCVVANVIVCCSTHLCDTPTRVLASGSISVLALLPVAMYPDRIIAGAVVLLGRLFHKGSSLGRIDRVACRRGREADAVDRFRVDCRNWRYGVDCGPKVNRGERRREGGYCRRSGKDGNQIGMRLPATGPAANSATPRPAQEVGGMKIEPLSFPSEPSCELYPYMMPRNRSRARRSNQRRIRFQHRWVDAAAPRPIGR
jgi:hypothetical protein